MKRSRINWAVIALTLACAVPGLFAVDGVVLIDHNRALAGNVTPGDTMGYPVTISLPGSYRLSGNLIPSQVNSNAIEITASSVSLDLNGFRVYCSYMQAFVGEVHCIGSTSALIHIEVRNGIVSVAKAAFPGFSIANGIGLQSSRGVTLENLRIDGVDRSLLVGEGSRIRNVILLAYPVIGCPSLIIESINLGGSFGATGSGCIKVNSLGSWPN